jgi:nicotinamide-nucleotide amidase
MTAAVLSIGTELTRGEIDNTNCTWLCERITACGVSVGECCSIADETATIRTALRRLASEHRVIVCTGGLGPTTDDLTSAAVALELGEPLRRDEASLESIKARYATAKAHFADSNAKQADFPVSAAVLSNAWGTAPGFSVDLGNCKAFFLPGVPREMKPMFDTHIAGYVSAQVGVRIHQVRLRSFGAAESAVADRLGGIEAEHDVVIGYRAHFPEIEVKVMATRADVTAAEHASRAAASVVEQRLGDLVYAEGDRALPEVVADLLRERGYWLSLAESCTGGLASELLTAMPASDYYKGAVVCYSNDVKEQLLGVPRAVLDEHGAVSEPTVRHLAEGARRVFGTEVGMAFSGIAGPSGGTPEKPVGLVHYAVATPLGVVTAQRVMRWDRPRNQLVAAWAGFDLLRRQLLGLPLH